MRQPWHSHVFSLTSLRILAFRHTRRHRDARIVLRACPTALYVPTRREIIACHCAARERASQGSALIHTVRRQDCRGCRSTLRLPHSEFLFCSLRRLHSLGEQIAFLWPFRASHSLRCLSFRAIHLSASFHPSLSPAHSRFGGASWLAGCFRCLTARFAMYRGARCQRHFEWQVRLTTRQAIRRKSLSFSRHFLGVLLA